MKTKETSKWIPYNNEELYIGYKVKLNSGTTGEIMRIDNNKYTLKGIRFQIEKSKIKELFYHTYDIL